jgi:phosphoribosylamine--glycine ligase
LGVTVLGATYALAAEKAYDAVSRIEFDGMHFRRDIGRKAF